MPDDSIDIKAYQQYGRLAKWVAIWKHIHNLAKHSTIWTNKVSMHSAIPLVYIFSKIGLSPNMVSTLSVLLGTLGIYVYASNPTDWMHIAGLAILLQLSYIMDAADGMLARMIQKGSLFGGWYDLVLDRLHTCIVISGIMIVYWPQAQGSVGYISYFSTFMALLAVVYTNNGANNLGMAMFPKDRDGSELRKNKPLLFKTHMFCSELCDYGLLMFILPLSLFSPHFMNIIQFIIIIYAVALTIRITYSYYLLEGC